MYWHLSDLLLAKSFIVTIGHYSLIPIQLSIPIKETSLDLLTYNKDLQTAPAKLISS